MGYYRECDRGISCGAIVTAGEIKRLRERMHLTQEQFAMTFDIAVSTLRQWEHGRRIPGKQTQVLLSIISTSPEIVREAIASRSH